MSPRTSHTSKVKVPKDAGEEIVLSIGGEEPVTYKVNDGTVTVSDQHLAVFLANVDGSEADAGNPASA